jgi:hypothetical protein
MNSTKSALVAVFGENFGDAVLTAIETGRRPTPEKEGKNWLERMFSTESKVIGGIKGLPGKAAGLYKRAWEDHPWWAGAGTVGALAGARSLVKSGAPGKAIVGAAGYGAGKLGQFGNAFIGSNFRPLADIDRVYRNSNYGGLADYLENPNIRKGRLPAWLRGGGLSGGTRIPQPNLPNLPKDLMAKLEGASGSDFNKVKKEVADELRARVAQAAPPKTLMGRLGGGLGKLLPQKFSEFFIGKDAGKELKAIEAFTKQKNAIMGAIDERTLYNPSFGKSAKRYKAYLDAAKNSEDLAKILEHNSGLKNLVKKVAPEALGDMGRYPLALRRVVGGALNIPGITDPARKVGNAFSGSGSAISRIRGGLYGSASLLGTGNAIATGEGVPRFVRYQEGRSMGRGLKWLQRGPMGIVSPGASAAMDIGQAFRTGENLTALGKGVRFTGKTLGKSVMAILDPITAVAKVGAGMASKVGLKGIGKALTKAIPVVGWASLVGDAVRGIDSDWANEHIWKKVFGGKTIGEAIWENKVADTFKKVLGDEAFNGIRDAMGHAMEAFKGLSRLFEEAFKTAIGFIKGVFTGDWTSFKEGLSGMWESLKDVFSNIGSYLWELLMAGWEFDKRLLGAIGDAFKGAWNWIASDDGVAGWPSKVWDLLTGIGSWIKERLYDAVGWFSQIFSSAWGWVKKEVPTWPSRVWELLKSIGTWIGARLGEAVGWFSQIFSAAWDWISDPYGSGPAAWPSKIFEFIKGIGTFISDNVESIGTVLYNSGKSVIDKIGEGIEAGWEILKEKVPLLGTFLKLGDAGIQLIIKGLEKVGVIGGDIGPDADNIIPGKITGYGGMQPTTEQAWKKLKTAFPGMNFWGGMDRKYHDKNSDHWYGKAFDINSTRAKMDTAADWLMNNFDALKLKYVIWEQQINSNDGRGWRDMKDRGSVTANHFDHIHASTYHSGGITPGAASQEMFALLRGQEAIIPLEGGAVPVKFKNGGGDVYKVTKVDVREGAFQFVVRDDDDIEQIKKAILELRKGIVPFRDSINAYPVEG